MHHLTGNIVAVNDCEEEVEKVEKEEKQEEYSPRLDLCARGHYFVVGGAAPPTERQRRRWWVKEATSRTSTTSSATNVPQNVLLNANCKKNYCYYELLIEWSWCGHTGEGEGEGGGSETKCYCCCCCCWGMWHVHWNKWLGRKCSPWLMYSMMRN